MKTILAPVDFSEISDAVVLEATTLARAFDAQVILLSVVQPPVVLHEYAAFVDIAEVVAAGEKHAAQQLEKLEQRLKANFVKTQSLQVSGPPVANIVEQAEKCDADYIVMGSHGHTAFYDLLVGSTTHGVLMRAQCPVIIVPAATQETAKKRPPARAATRL